MGVEVFAYENCPLKHYIRKEVWLPLCKQRLAAIRAAAKNKSSQRRLRYFTFCAVGALDVLLLDREKVIRRSQEREFDTVYFFDVDEDAVVETKKRIPGATGFPGDFVSVVLDADMQAGDALDSPLEEQNTREVRQEQMRKSQLKRFKESFPFDVLNLDVEQYLFRPKEALPGKLMSALRKIFEWQTQIGKDNNKEYSVDEFTLMFTTQVGPENLSNDYLIYLRDTCLQRNLDTHVELAEPFATKSGGKDVQTFFAEDFEEAFKLAVPKSLIELAIEQDWHIDGKQGVQVYQFDRPSKDGPYTMLHMVMTVRRQDPPKHKRAPGQGQSDVTKDETKQSIVRLFSDEVVSVEEAVAAKKAEIESDLAALFEHRSKIYREPDAA